MFIPVITRSYDNARSGVNTAETELTPDAVRNQGIKKLFSLQMTGDARGIEAQPLILPGVELPDGSIHDIVYLADMANQVWAFDANDGARLWMRRLGTPVTGSRTIDTHNINDHWGILGTPVIDQAAATMFLVAWISPDGSVANAQHYCYALDTSNGQDRFPPLNLEAATYDPGHGIAPQMFRSAARKQRPGLLLTDVQGVKTVFIGFGSTSETGANARGWIIACSTSPFQVAAAWASTAKGSGGGIWQGAGGLAADSNGALYLMTGNGDFDGVTDFSESFVKLRYAPPAAQRAASISVVDWWTAFSDNMRTATGDDPAFAAPPGVVTPTATNYRAATGGMGGNPWSDMDLGSAGPILLEKIDAVLGAGKDGIAYVLSMQKMGQTTPADLTAPATNYAKLKVPPIFFTYYPPGLNPAPDDIQTLNLYYDNQTHHLHGGPVIWDSPDRGPLVYCWGENGNLRAWSLGPTGQLTYLACSLEWASQDVPDQPGPNGIKGGMPGGMISLSANGETPHSGILWALIPYGDANLELVNGRLLAYDATVFGAFPGGGAQIEVLWDSQAWNIPFLFNKFNRPVVSGGRLFVPTYSDTVDVYGLA